MGKHDIISAAARWWRDAARASDAPAACGGQGPALSPGLQARWGPLSAAPRPREVSAARWGLRPILEQSRRLSWTVVVGLSSAAERMRVEESCQTQPAW